MGRIIATQWGKSAVSPEGTLPWAREGPEAINNLDGDLVAKLMKSSS